MWKSSNIFVVMMWFLGSMTGNRAAANTTETEDLFYLPFFDVIIFQKWRSLVKMVWPFNTRPLLLFTSPGNASASAFHRRKCFTFPNSICSIFTSTADTDDFVSSAILKTSIDIPARLSLLFKINRYTHPSYRPQKNLSLQNSGHVILGHRRLHLRLTRPQRWSSCLRDSIGAIKSSQSRE